MAAATFDPLSGLTDQGQQQQAKQQTPQPVQRPAFCPPHVNIGDVVYWYSAARRSNRPAPAIVTDVEGNVLYLTVFVKGRIPQPTKDAIRHIDDPFFQTNQAVAVKSGAWDRKG